LFNVLFFISALTPTPLPHRERGSCTNTLSHRGDRVLISSLASGGGPCTNLLDCVLIPSTASEEEFAMDPLSQSSGEEFAMDPLSRIGRGVGVRV